MSMKRPVIGLNMTMSAKDNFSIYAEYVDATEDVGGLPLCLPPCGERENIMQALKILDGILFIGGKDYFSKHYD